MCSWERRTRCFVFFDTRNCVDFRHLHTKRTHTSTGNLYQLQDWMNNNRSLIECLKVSLSNGIKNQSQLTKNWNKIKKSFKTSNRELASYVKYFNIVLLLSRDEKVASRLIDYLTEIGDVEVEMGALFKDLLVADFEKLMLRFIQERNTVKCRRLLKIIMAQGHLLQVKKWLDIIAADLEVYSDNDVVLLNGMILNLMDKFLIDGATDDFIEIRRKCLGKIGSKDISKLLFRLLENEQITLEVYLQLMENEHYVLSKKEGSFIKARCTRSPTWECTSKVVSRHRGVCEVCGEKLKKDKVTEREFKLASEDYMLKVSDLFIERNFGTMYFENLRNFVQITGPFHYFIDTANVMSGNEPNIKQILKVVETLPVDKKICIITDNEIRKKELPENVFHFKVDRFVFRPQDDLLVLMGILVNGPDTVLISNDSYRNIFALLRDGPREIMQRWQRVNQLPFFWDEHGNITLFPKLFSRTTQRSSWGWHVPFHSDNIPELDVSFLCIQKK